MPKSNTKIMSLGGGLLTAILSSICCLGPLVLLTLGIGGAWVSNLRFLEDYKYIMMVFSVAMLAFAFKNIYFPKQAECATDKICAKPAVNKGYKISFWIISFVVVFLIISPFLAPLFY